MDSAIVVEEFCFQFRISMHLMPLIFNIMKTVFFRNCCLISFFVVFAQSWRLLFNLYCENVGVVWHNNFNSPVFLNVNEINVLIYL